MTDVEESARRLANLAHVLRELVHLTAGHLALEPRFETKGLLGDHLHDDARAAAALYERIAQLGQAPRAPGPELAARLDRVVAAPDYLEVAYGELKPALVASALRAQLARARPADRGAEPAARDRAPAPPGAAHDGAAGHAPHDRRRQRVRARRRTPADRSARAGAPRPRRLRRDRRAPRAVAGPPALRARAAGGPPRGSRGGGARTRTSQRGWTSRWPAGHGTTSATPRRSTV